MAQDGNLPKCGKCGRPMRSGGEKFCYLHRKKRQCNVCRKYCGAGMCPGCRELMDDLHAAHAEPPGVSAPRVLLRIVSVRGLFR